MANTDKKEEMACYDSQSVVVHLEALIPETPHTLQEEEAPHLV
jgi:hypothetical protein